MILKNIIRCCMKIKNVFRIDSPQTGTATITVTKTTSIT